MPKGKPSKTSATWHLPDLQLTVTGNTTLPDSSRTLNPPSQSDGTGPIGFGDTSAVMGIPSWETIMPGGYGTFSCKVAEDEVVNYPNTYVQQAHMTLATAEPANGIPVGFIVWQGFLTEPVRNATGEIELQGNGYWTLLQEKEDPLFWASGDGDGWSDLEEDPFKPAGTQFKNSDGIDVAARKASLKFKVGKGTGIKGIGGGSGPLDQPTDHAAAGIDVTKQHKITRVSFRRLQNRDNPNGNMFAFGIWKADRPDQNKNQWRKVQAVNINSKVNIDAGDYFERKIDKLATENDDAHVIIFNMYADGDGPSGGLNNDFVVKFRDLVVNGDAYRDLSFPVDHPQWGGDIPGNYGSEYRTEDPETGEIGGYTANEMVRDIAYMWLGDSGDLTPGGGGVQSKIPNGAKYGPGPYAGDGTNDPGTNQRRHDTESATGRISDILRDGTDTFDLLPEWWNDGSWWDFLEHLAHKYGNKIAFWDLDIGFEFSSWRHKYAPWTKTWQVDAYSDSAFTNADLQPAEEIYSGVIVRYKLKHSRRAHYMRKDINPNPFAGLPGPERQRFFKFHLKERRKDSRLAARVATILADHLNGIRLSGEIGPLSYVYDEADGSQVSALKPRAGDKVRIRDMPCAVLEEDINDTETLFRVSEVGGTGAAGPHGRIGTNIVQHAEFNIAIVDSNGDREIMHVTKRSVNTATNNPNPGPKGAVFYTVQRDYDQDEETSSGTGLTFDNGTTVYFWLNLRLMGTTGTLEDGVMFNCTHRPLKIERYLWHSHRRHNRERFHGR